MIEWFKSTKLGQWFMKHKWARRGALAFLAFQLLKSTAWTVFFIMLYLGYIKH